MTTCIRTSIARGLIFVSVLLGLPSWAFADEAPAPAKTEEPLPPPPPPPEGATEGAPTTPAPAVGVLPDAPAPAPHPETHPKHGSSPPPSAVAIVYDDAPSGSDLDSHPASRWYGWQTLATDGAAVTLVVIAGSVAAGNSSDPAEALAYTALSTYVLGGPIVHVVHGNYGRAAGSLVLRAGAPIVGGALGCAADGSTGTVGCLGGLALGVLVGTLTAVVVDSAALGYESVPRRREVPSDAKRSLSWAPDIAVTRDRSVVAGVHGEF